MSFSKMISGLQKSTKITIIGCAAFLAVTALVLLFLMLFPIEPEETPTLQINQPQQTAVPEETQETQPSEDGKQTEAPHTLSTWSASIEGYSRSTDEYFEYIRSTYEPQETMWHQYSTETTEQTMTGAETDDTVVSETGSWDETGTTEPKDTDASDSKSSDYIHTGSQTVTETVVIPPASSDPEPPQSDPPATDPPSVEQPATNPPTPVVDVPGEVIPAV